MIWSFLRSPHQAEIPTGTAFLSTLGKSHLPDRHLMGPRDFLRFFPGFSMGTWPPKVFFLNLQKAIEHGPVEIVDLPIKKAWWIFPVRLMWLFTRPGTQCSGQLSFSAGGDIDVESLMKVFEPDSSSCATPRTHCLRWFLTIF